MMEWMRKYDVFTRLLSLICAVLLWFFVIDSQDKVVYKTISQFPVEFTGTERLANNDLIIIEGAQSYVAFRVEGRNSKVSDIDYDLMRAAADLSNITMPGSYDVKYQLTTGIADIRFEKITSSVRVVVDRMVSKPVPVELTLSGGLEEGYILDGYSVKPDAITVTGPQTILDTIVSAKAVYDISGLQESTESTISYTLVDADGEEVKSSFVSVTESSAQLKVTIRQTGEIPLVLNVNDYGFITDDVIEVRMEPETIKVNGSPEDISALNQIDIGTLDLQTIFENEDFEIELPLILPNGVTAEEEITKVKVTIDLKDVEKISLKIPAEELPESADFTYVSDLMIDIWTTADRAAFLSAASVDLELTYDPAELHPGFNELPVLVTALDDAINVIGEYSVVVEVTEEDVPVDPSELN